MRYLSIIKTTLLDYLKYIFSNKVFSKKLKLNNILILFIFDFLLYYPVTYILNLLGASEKHFPDLSYMDEYTFFSQLLYLSILVPLQEEFIYRLPLKPKSYFLFAGFVIFLVFTIISVGNLKYLYGLLLISVIVWFYLPMNKQTRTLTFFKKYFKIYFHLIAIIFALSHTYLVEGYYIYYNLIYLIPFLNFAYIVGYLRMNNGIIYSIGYHAAFNFLLVTNNFLFYTN